MKGTGLVAVTVVSALLLALLTLALHNKVPATSSAATSGRTGHRLADGGKASPYARFEAPVAIAPSSL